MPDNAANLITSADFTKICTLRHSSAGSRNIANNTACCIIAGNFRLVDAGRNTAVAAKIGNNARSIIKCLNASLYRQIFNGTAIDIAKQCLVVALIVNEEVFDRKPSAIEAALEIVGGVVGAALSDRCPTLIAQVNVIAEHGAELFICVFSRCALIYLLRQPGQFTSLCDLVHTVFQRRFFNIVRTLPRDLFLQWDGHRLIPRLGHFGQIDSVALLGVIRTLKRPIVFVAHGQLVCAVLVGPHFPLPGRDGQFSLVRVLKCHRHHRLGGQRERLCLVLFPHLHGVGKLVIAEGRCCVVVSTTHHSIAVARVGCQCLLSACNSQRRTLRQSSEGQLVLV